MDLTTDTKPNAQQTLADLAVRIPAASRVFRQAGLDYCCHGNRSVASACAEKGLDPDALLSRIQQETSPDGPAWKDRSIPELIQHILTRYHESHRREVPELLQMAERVEEKHREKAGCPHGLAEHLRGVHESLLSHMEKEEQILFPMILAGHGQRAFGPIQVMETEHQDHGASLARTRELTGDFQAPDEACPTWRALYLRLEELEGDLMDHISLENNVIFPRVLFE